MTELEDRVRATLRERAADIVSVPRDVLSPAAAPPHRGRGLVVLAAAAVVVAVAGIVLALRATDAGPSPAGAACTTILPTRWRTAVTSLPHTRGSDYPAPVAVAPDGTAYLDDAGVLTAVSIAGKETDVFRVPNPDNEAIDGVFADRDHVLVTLTWLPLGAEHLRPNPALTDPVTLDVYLIDRHTGAVRRIAGTTGPDLVAGHDVVDDAVLYGGSVFWDLRPDAGSQQGRLVEYDPTTGRTRVVMRGAMDAPHLVGGRVVWSFGEYRSGHGPRSPHLNPDTHPVTTDGVGWAWVGDDVIHWASLQAQRTIRLTQLPSPQILAVAGPLVFVWDELHDRKERVWILDTRSAALAPLGFGHGGDVFSAGGYVVTYAANRGPVRIDTNELPALHC